MSLPGIQAIGTAVPQTRVDQSDFLDVMGRKIRDVKARRYLETLRRGVAIRKRHTVATFQDKGEVAYNDVPISSMSSGERNAIYVQEAPKLALAATQDALERAGMTAQDITHIITVTCTGFYNPGFDFEVINCLGVSSQVHRYNIGFMGCYGMFPALELAAELCRSNPDNRVLCLGVELCSIHHRETNSFDDLMAAMLFADGAAAVLVSCADEALARIAEYSTKIVPASLGDMAWKIGDQGFDITLSPYVARLLQSNLEKLLPGSWSKESAAEAAWAVHPGGASILKRVQESLFLRETQLEQSWSVLREFGNMSSVTIAFILKKMLAEESIDNKSLRMIGFGPGLTAKTISLRMESSTV